MFVIFFLHTRLPIFIFLRTIAGSNMCAQSDCLLTYLRVSIFMFVMVSARFVGSSYILTSTLSIQASLFFFLPYSHSISAAFVSNRYRYQSYMRTMRSNFGILRSIIAYTSVSSQLLNIKV